MDDTQAPSSSTPATRARGRGKSRGGLGKYLRARGRGRGRGRPAEWGHRLVLEGEEQTEVDAEEQEEQEKRYARRQLGSNADRYVEPQPELDSEGEEVVEPEVDLSAFLERQRHSPGPSVAPPPVEDEDVDTSLSHIGPRVHNAQSKKGRVQKVDWDAELEKMNREKAAAEATWELKSRFRAQTEKQRGKPTQLVSRVRTQERVYVEAPPLPTDQPKPERTEKEGMQDFLDDLLG
ncbi:predicted protein [Sparassis crispa]|uniref:Uncharacterized protein n=1 Tax=Sparassis crispa TaxID=139825 RepID=A0A401GY06_9APHY|nr:predicted protein [Sparassis crispa]GBE87039.1 predicted protein [Sparassis crispa]